ncbi:MAG: ribonuclease H family protein [Clostridiales bacterium]|nr:ribonuclease H family protein [Clostridiales bacterium]
MSSKYYAVKVGKTPGIYYNWNDCKAMVDGFPGAVYKSFKTLQEADDFLNENLDRKMTPELETGKTEHVDGKVPEVYAFVDGSFHAGTKVYGYGGFLVHHGKKEILQGSGDEPEMASMRNVAGEVLGSMAAMKLALELGLEELTIYYDYMGIEMWATGAWKRNKAGTIAYYDYVNSIRGKLKINFVKVKGHSGVEGNEEADRLAKEAVGILE